MFKVFAGEFEGEPFLKGSPSIILLLNLLLYRLVLVVELVVGAGEAVAGEEADHFILVQVHIANVLAPILIVIVVLAGLAVSLLRGGFFVR